MGVLIINEKHWLVHNYKHSSTYRYNEEAVHDVLEQQNLL
jgi:hypothetical protein